MSGLFRLAALSACILAATSPSGCVNRDLDGPTITYSFAWWVPVLVALGSIVAAPIGWLLRKHWARLAWPLMILSPVGLFIVVPGLINDRVKVDDRHFEVHTGMWGLGTDQDIAFDDVTDMTLVTREKRGRRGRKTTEQALDCTLRGGQHVEVNLGSLMEYAFQDVVDQAKQHGVRLGERDER